MNTNQKLAVTTLTVATVVAYSAVSMNNFNKDIYCRFPELDRKIARKAYRRFLMKSFLGVYGDLQHKDDVAMDALFLEEVQKLHN